MAPVAIYLEMNEKARVLDEKPSRGRNPFLSDTYV
jgi:hypothetical protein